MAALRQSVTTFGHGTAYKLSFAALVYLDVLLTVVAMRAGYTEMNPLVVGLMASPWLLALVKGVAPLFLAWLIPHRLLLPSIGFMAGVVGWNMKELLIGL